MIFTIVEKFINQLKPEKYTDISPQRFEKNLTNIYELEYKLSKIKNSENFENNKYLQDLYNIGIDYLNKNLNEILKIFHEIIEEWVNDHEIFTDEEYEIYHDIYDKIQEFKKILKEIDNINNLSTNEKIILLHKVKQLTHTSGNILQYLNIFYNKMITDKWAFDLFNKLSNFNTKIWDNELKKEIL